MHLRWIARKLTRSFPNTLSRTWEVVLRPRSATVRGIILSYFGTHSVIFFYYIILLLFLKFVLLYNLPYIDFKMIKLVL